MHKHVMWAVCDAVCDVSVVQPHLYFGLFGWVCLVGGIQLLQLFPSMHT